MTAILSRCSLENGAALRLRTKVPAVELVVPWFLVMRRATWRTWHSKRPELSNAHVALFENIVAGHGDADDFDQLVLRTVGCGFYAEWKIGE